MNKKLWGVLVATLILLVLSITLIGLRENQELLIEIDSNKAHLKNISLSNQISSLVKRAEGHLLMYLLQGDRANLDKFSDRLEAMIDKIDELDQLRNSRPEIPLIKDSFVSTQEVIQLGGEITAARDAFLNHAPTMDIDTYNAKLRRLRAVVSVIRGTGEQLVQLSTDHLRSMENTTIKESKYARIALVVLPTMILGLILMLGYQTNLLLASEKNSQRLDILSHIDELTNIANRRSIDNTLDIEWNRALREKKPISIMMIDVDHFKDFNDNYGHQEGDICLTKIAITLQSCLKRSTDVVARYGGEEFLIVMPNTDDGESLAEDCRHAIELLQTPHEYSKTTNVVTISIGICSRIPESRSGKGQLVRDADSACYHAKRSGRNQIYTYNSEQNLLYLGSTLEI